MQSDCKDTTLLGSFMENHDNPRFPSTTSDITLAKNAIAYTILADGIPIIYYGQEQHFSGGSVPNNREALWLSGYPSSSVLYTHIQKINQLRSHVISQSSAYVTSKAAVVFSNNSTLVTRKGSVPYSVLGIFNNLGSQSASSMLSLSSSETGFGDNEQVIEVLSCNAYTTSSSGTLTTTILNGLPQVFYAAAQLQGSGICSTASACSSTPVTFDLTETTTYGEAIYITGNISSLGDWSTNSGIALSASEYTSSDHLWYVTIDFAPGTAFQYKYYKTETDGSVTWEGGNNRQYVVDGCAATTENDMWQS